MRSLLAYIVLVVCFCAFVSAQEEQKTRKLQDKFARLQVDEMQNPAQEKGNDNIDAIQLKIREMIQGLANDERIHAKQVTPEEIEYRRNEVRQRRDERRVQEELINQEARKLQREILEKTARQIKRTQL